MVEITRLRIFRRSVQILCAVCLALSTSAIPSAPDRDTWQRPDEVMDAMEAHLGSTVADVGAGEGWFTRKLAQRVGAKGTVFAVDVQPAMVEEIRHWSIEEHLRQVIPVLGAEDDPHLPDGQVDAVLVVNAYHEMKAYDAMLHSFYQALKLGCRLVIIEPEAKPGRPRAEYQKEHVIPAELVKDDAARNGFQFVAQHPDIVTPDQHHWPFLVFEKPGPKPSTSVCGGRGSPPTSTEKIAPRIPLEILIQLVRSGATRTGLQFVERFGDIIAHDGDGLDFLVCKKPTKTLK